MRNQVRIIAGQWRGRKISFPEKLSLRPTSDRIKETLFNWLAPHIIEARCLELFAGSAALSFEALSRYASTAIAIEKDSEIVAAIRKNALLLNINTQSPSFSQGFQVIQADCLHWLQTTEPPLAFDIVFLDPPYADNKILPCLTLLNKPGWLSEKGLVYFESDKAFSETELATDWIILKEKKAGQVFFYLIQKKK